MKKTMLSLVSACLIVAITFPAFAAIVSGNYHGIFDYRQSTRSTTISKWTATESNAVVVVPDEINGIPVTSITASDEDYYIESLFLPDTISTALTFKNWTELKEINIPKYMGIDDSMFEGCANLQSVTFSPESTLKRIGRGAFRGCDNLEELILPASFSNAYYDSFWCPNMQNIYVDSANEDYIDINGVLCYVADSAPGGRKGYAKIEYIPTGRSGDYIIPEGVDYVDFEALPSYQLDRIIFNENTRLYGVTSPGGKAKDILEIDMHFPIIVCYRNSAVAKQAIKYKLPYEYIDADNSHKSDSGGSSAGSTSSAVIMETVGSWQQNEYGWRLQLPDSSYFSNGWAYKQGKWYYFDGNGYMHTGWILDINGKWYYLDMSGAMLIETTTPDGYYVGSDGAWN